MSKSAWTVLISKCDTFKLHDMCNKNGCKGQKQIRYTANQFQIEGSGLGKTMIKKFNIT